MFDIATIITRAALGASAGISYAFLGFAKTKGEPMDWLRFAKTGVLGAVIGVGSEFTGLPEVSVETYLVNAGATGLVENALKALWRRVFDRTPAPK